MAYNKNLSINQNNVVNISGSQITLTGSLYGSQVSGTTAQFTSFTASNFQVKNDLYVSGGLTVGKYIQMLPVGALEIPANQTASYIYTSGSTNDLYFTQYQPGTNFTNTTRLRWLESTLSTGLLHGGVLSTVNGTTTFSLTSGSGLIITYNASTGSDPYPTIKYVNWTASVSQSLTKVTASQISYISVAEDGEIIQSDKAPTFAEYKDRIFIGRVLHQSGSVTNGAINTPPTAYGLATSTADFIRAIGPLKINGHFLAASGSSLSLTKSAGDSYVEGRNYAGNPNIPNIILALEDPAVTVSKIYRQHVSGGNPVIDTGIANAGYVDVNPTKYQDANGNLINVGNANFSVQRVFWFPKAVNRALFVYYGQALYSNLDDAIAGISTENFTEGENTKGSAILVGFLVMRGSASNFDTPNTARIYQASTFRGGGAGGGGGSSGGGTTLPAGSSSYVQFNDVGSFGADSRFTFDKISHTLTVAGTGSFSQLTTGPLTASAAYISGSLTVTGSTALQNVSASAISASTFTGSTGRFATVSGTTAEFNGNVLIYGTASLAANPTSAYVLYSSSLDRVVIFPGLFVSGSLTASNVISSSIINVGILSASNTRLTGTLSGTLLGTASYSLNSNLLDGLDSTAFAVLANTQTFSGVNTFSSATNQFTGSFSGSRGQFTTLTGSTISASSYLGSARGTAGQIQFNTGSNALGADSTFTWDNTNKRLAVGKSAANTTLDILGNTIISGNLTVTGSITELSTRRIKTNITSLNDELTTISKLNPVSYTRLDDGRREYGFISEEVKEVYPEFVVGEGINYPKMVSILVSAVKELTEKIENQSTEIQLLKDNKKLSEVK